jgi:hypothetical protein
MLQVGPLRRHLPFPFFHIRDQLLGSGGVFGPQRCGEALHYWRATAPQNKRDFTFQKTRRNKTEHDGPLGVSTSPQKQAPRDHPRDQRPEMPGKFHWTWTTHCTSGVCRPTRDRQTPVSAGMALRRAHDSWRCSGTECLVFLSRRRTGPSHKSLPLENFVTARWWWRRRKWTPGSRSSEISVRPWVGGVVRAVQPQPKPESAAADLKNSVDPNSRHRGKAWRV